MVLVAFSAKAQVNLHINQTNIGQGAMHVDHQSVQYGSVLSVAPTINIGTSDTFFKIGTTTTTLNANLFRAIAVGSGGQQLNLSGVAPGSEAILSTTFTPIYSSLLGLLASGLLNVRYSIPNPKLYAWKAGTYSNNLKFSLTGISLGSITPKATNINVTVDPFISVSPTQNIEITVDRLDYYRSLELKAKSQSFSVTSTLNTGIRTKSNTPLFTYSNGYQGGADPRAPATVVMAHMVEPQLKTGEFLTGTTFRTMTNTGGIVVPIGNTSNVSMSYSLSHDVLRNNFLKKGAYTLNLNHEVFDAEPSGNYASQSLSSTLVVNVADMASVVVNQNDVNLVFKTAADYKNGVYIDMPAHLTLSATSPYDVFVQTGSSSLKNGTNSIPVTALQVSVNSTDPLETTPLNLAATRQRMLSILPVIDKKVNIRYAITAAQAAKVLGKASGTYTTTVTYTLVAP